MSTLISQSPVIMPWVHFFNSDSTLGEAQGDFLHRADNLLFTLNDPLSEHFTKEACNASIAELKPLVKSLWGRVTLLKQSANEGTIGSLLTCALVSAGIALRILSPTVAIITTAIYMGLAYTLQQRSHKCSRFLQDLSIKPRSIRNAKTERFPELAASAKRSLPS